MQTDLTGFAAADGGSNRLLASLPPSAGWLLETVITFSLIFVIFIATDTRRGQSTSHIPMLAPAAIGFAVFACHLAAVALDGCSVNPARSFGPAVTAGEDLLPAQPPSTRQPQHICCPCPVVAHCAVEVVCQPECWQPGSPHWNAAPCAVISAVSAAVACPALLCWLPWLCSLCRDSWYTACAALAAALPAACRSARSLLTLA